MSDKIPQRFTQDQVKEIVNEDVFIAIPEIEALNHKKIEERINEQNETTHPDNDFIDLRALARNVFYMILRESITNGS